MVVGNLANLIGEYGLLDKLFSLITLIAFLQPNAQRFIVAIFYGSSIVLHGVLFATPEFIPNNMYPYFSVACLFDLICIVFIQTIRPVTRFNLSMQYVCLVSIILNITGWLMKSNGIKSDMYVIAFTALYLFVLFLLIKRDRLLDVGGYRVDIWVHCFSAYRFTRYFHLSDK